MASATFTSSPLIAKMLNYGPLSAEEQAALEGSVSATRDVPLGADMVIEGTSPDHSTLLLSGFAGRYSLREDGKRQITALHVAGDFVDLHSLLMRPMDHSIVALTTCKIAVVPHSRLVQITDQFTRLTRMLWLSTLIDGGIHRKWEFCLGSLQAHQHLAHLICELYLRRQQVHPMPDGSFHLPLTQVLMGECLAISSVHANRATQTLRATGVVTWERDLITVKDWDGLAALAEFDPTYLRMELAA